MGGGGCFYFLILLFLPVTFHNSNKREWWWLPPVLFLIRGFYNILLKYDPVIGSLLFELLPRKISCFHVGVGAQFSFGRSFTDDVTAKKCVPGPRTPSFELYFSDS